jgi:hypothetical protein
VTFNDSTTTAPLGSGTLSNGTFTLPTQFCTVGTHDVTAVYGGSSTYATSTSDPLTFTINPASTLISTTTTVTGPASNPAAGANFTLTATVAPAAATGIVTFYDSTQSPPTSLGTGTLNNGTATLSTSYAAAGTYSITATYSGDCNYATSSTLNALTITVSQ